jgi:hypothetical protein
LRGREVAAARGVFYGRAGAKEVGIAVDFGLLATVLRKK